MEFSISVTEFQKRLAIANRAIPSRPSHPVLANVLIEANRETQQVSFTGFDLSVGIKTVAIAQVAISGRITLPAKLLGDIVTRLPEGDLLVTMEDLTVRLKGVGDYQVQGLAADEYPELPDATESEAILPSELFLQGISSTAPFASTDESRQILGGIRFERRADEMEFAATDGHRLSVRTIALETPEGDVAEPLVYSVTIPAKALRDLSHAVNGEQPIAVSLDQHQIVFRWHDGILTSRLLEGEYPNYSQLIPNRFSVIATGDRRQLIALLERISVLADKKNNIVKLSFSQERQQIEITVEAPDVGSGYEVMPCQVSGDLAIAFNVRYLLEGLKAMRLEEIQIQMNSPTSPTVVEPVGSDKHKYLAMPIQIRS